MSRLTLALALVVLVLEAVVVALLLQIGDADTSTWLNLSLALPVGLVFGIAGLVALARRPENRTGFYLAAVGFLWPLNVLADASDDVLFTIGATAGELAWVPCAALILAYPTGRLDTVLDRAIPVATGMLLVASSLLILLFDASPRDGDAESAIAVADLPGLVNVVRALSAVGVVGLIVLVVLRVVRRWRGATPAQRRLIWPVVGAAVAALVAIGLVVVMDEMAPGAADAMRVVFFLAFATIPLAFLFGILRLRLARSSAAAVVLALERGVPLRDALAAALRDPTLELAYRLEPGRGIVGGDGWVDPEGRSVPEPSPQPGRAVRFIARRNERIGAISYDATFASEPELVDAVIAAARLALANERLQAELRAEIRLTRALADTAPALLTNVDTSGRFLKINPASLRAAGYERDEELLGRHFWEVFIDEDERAAMVDRFHAAAPDFPAAEYENTFTNAKGERLVIYWRAAPVHDEHGNVVSIVGAGLDVTERHRLELEKERERRQAERQRDFLEAITQVVPSFLIAVDEDAVVVEHLSNRAFLDSFGWPEEEIIGQSFLGLVAREDDHAARMTIANAANGLPQPEHESVWQDRAGNERIVAWTARPVLDPTGRQLVLVSGSDVTVRRRQEEEIKASRARLLAAEEDTRRKLERNLHDGAQQRLVALSVALRLAESKLDHDREGARSLLAGAREELGHALEELRELARGIHPAMLTTRGLGPALESLVSRMSIPVELRHPDERLAPAVEAAAYYVIAESLTNVAKYAQASGAAVEVTRDDGRVVVTVTDDGVGGADPLTGSGLRGLADRVAALDGILVVESAAGAGTRVRAEIPLPAEAEE